MTIFSLLVLRARDLETTADFYRAFGLEFTSEQHGSGPPHFACERDGFVLEIYPLKASQSEVDDSIMLGFAVESLEVALQKLNLKAEIKTGNSRFCNCARPRWAKHQTGRTMKFANGSSPPL